MRRVDGVEELLPRGNLPKVENEAGRSVVRMTLEVLGDAAGKDGNCLGWNGTVHGD